MNSFIKKGLLTLALVGSLGFGARTSVAYAQDATTNLAAVGDQSGLGSEDIRIVIASFIRTALTFLGVIAVCIVLYGGFVWMTASGDAEKVERAKKILINGGIGLVIILMSWSITTFILTSILGATNGTGGSGGSGGGSGGVGSGSGSASSVFEVTGITPEGTQTIRNIAVQATFSQAVDEASASPLLTVTNVATGENVEGTVTVSGRRATFVPSAACPTPNEDRFCFDENTAYVVTVNADSESTTGRALTCTSESCSGSFTSGTLVDTEDPVATMTAPDDRDAIAADSFERAEVRATDDAGIATADFSVDGETFESVSATASDITDVVLETIWDTTGLTVGESYEVSVIVTDVAGNTDEDAVTVTARPATCFNGVQDEDMGETDVDCGGDSTSASYCGACDGSSCSESSVCGGSSSCEDGVCSDLPEISGISPDNGAVGSYVTISGSGFGNSEGHVYFTAEDGTTVSAAVASCADGWSDTEIIVVVPEGAADGPVSVMTSGGDIDYTNDEEGELVPDFDVNDVERPALCSLTPDTGMVADAIALAGSGFGSSRGTSTVIFGIDDEAASYTSWSDGSIIATVPSVNEGDYSVSVLVDGVESNTVTFSVTEEAAESAPTIVSIDPGAGGPGQYITISGNDFGSSVGSVWFENNETGNRTLASIDFPSACADDIWSDTQVTVIVPDVTAGAYLLSVESRRGESSAVAFTVTEEDPTPGLCSLSPDNGEAGDAVTLYGDNFGSSGGSVSFATALTGTVIAWSNDEIAVTVPASVETGSVSVTSSSGSESNGLMFTAGTDSSVSATAIAAAYAWSFSSGEIPDVPEVVVACSDTVVSAVPNDRFTDAACVNADIYAEFTVDMNEGTLNDALTVEKCTASGDQPCDETSPVVGSYATTARSVTFSPAEDLSVATTYQVTVSTSAMSADASALAQDVTWTFTTKAESTDCEVERVVVSPDAATLEAESDTQEFSALPIADCVVLHADDYTWSWDADESYATLSSASDPEDCNGGSSSCATATALAEGETPVTATERASAEAGSGELTINFSDPYVTRYFPNCTEACTNATVGAEFNVPMDETSMLSGTSLYLCENELCATGATTEVLTATPGCTVNEDDECTGFNFSLASPLTAGAYYRVILSGDATSSSGVPLIRTNYGEDFSWKFRVREDGSVCAVERVAMSPASAQSSEVGDRKVFTAEAYGEADSCSVSGQLLNAYSYAWTWADPIPDEDKDSEPATVVAEWIGMADTDVSSIAEGCTASCTSIGSEPHAAVCGDGVLDVTEGEECEDGNVSSGDGCSSMCLREGTTPATYLCTDELNTCTSLSDTTTCPGGETCEVASGECGNGAISENEDCDDGNSADGDGCSSTCLAEGSASVGATCGNNDIALNTTTYAGEECDDGNAKNGDGCSSSCLNEGTPTLASIGGAICGDGAVDAPYEACDDGNTNNDDGCSSLCLYEGSSRSYASASVCGDSVQGTGEECDDGNSASGDGCSLRCLLEGSSAAYENPSYCGDGVVGGGEVSTCEVGAGGDGNIDPVQAARIARTAVFEVDSETGEATATVSALESSSSFTASADWTLFCAATSDTDCSSPTTQGVGVGNCCMERPTVTLTPTGSDVCRNAALYGRFTQPMDTDSFTYKNADGETSYRMYASLDVSTVGGVCPETHTTLAQAPGGFFARAWRTVKSWIFGKEALATAGDCVVPITGFSQEAQSDESYIVYMQTDELLAANGVYTLVVEGDENVSDGVVSGVQSRYGVGMYGNTEEAFVVGSEICAVDAVEVTDDDSSNPGAFSSLADEHTFSATALSYSAGVQEIAPISGVYDWTWSSWSADDDTILSVSQDGAGADTATVSPAGENGTANVIATLAIQNNTTGIETESEVSGYKQVNALLCENPWPAIAYYPWTDNADGAAVGAERGIGWTNFSLGYCRDNGENGTDDDFPGLTVISPDDTQDDTILKEYLFQVEGSSDAIGVRVAKNEEYLSPMAWYIAQGFTGSPSETTIDGFPAVEDGRTTYIAAPNFNQSANYLYSNMYIISYNSDAGSEAQNIYEQIVENILFGTNLSSVGYCSNGSAYSTTCSSDLDCDVASGESCADIKSKVARDAGRLTDMTDLRTSIQDYGESNGYCSETTSQICSTSADCPGGESCNPGVPTLSSGTFVRAFASSVWGSWEDILGGALNENIGTDPLNTYDGCGTGAFESYDAETCVDKTRGNYICPENSFAYHYRSFGSDVAYIAADLEYPNGDWFYAIDEDGTDDGVEITIGNSTGSAAGFSTDAFCDGVTAYGGSAVCGDGLIGAGEACEIGEAGGTTTACDSDGDGVDDGYISQICNNTCTAFEENASATCTPASCGNGIVEDLEACDDGTANGRYGYCGNDCTYTTAMYCGDGELSGGELCDCGDADVFANVSDVSTDRAYGASSVDSCGAFNGVYTASSSVSCAWDCSGPASYCGDGEVTGSEQCDGADDTWSGALCYGGTDNGDICSTDADCSGGVCGGSGAYAACATGYARVLPCDDENGGTCQYTSNWTSVACTEVGSCGDGTVDADEECDDGNADGSDACTTECTLNVCGDGYLYSGEEECDEGAGNGLGCDASYGSTCSACTTSCRQTVSSGAFCGDGVVNGSEYCDGSDIPYQYYDSATGQTGGACDASEVGQTDSSGVYTCRRLGMCDGGPENGAYCTASSTGFASGDDTNACSSGGTRGISVVSCVFPTCADSCMSSCPLTDVTTSLLMTPNLPGSSEESSVDLYSYSASSTSDLPNAATITMPACNVAGTLTGTIDMSNVDLPDAYVVFVTDRSGSMSAGFSFCSETTSLSCSSDSDCPGSETCDSSTTRMSVARDLLESSVTSLFEGLGENMHISLVGYSNDAGTGMCSSGTTYSCNSDDDCSGSATCDALLTDIFADDDGFGTVSDESTLQSRILEFENSGNTYTGDALTEAKRLLDAVDDDGNVRKIVVLLSDGDPTDDPDAAADALKAATTANGAPYEVYTVALVDASTDEGASLATSMNGWSSNDGASINDNGIDYAYDGDTATELESAYQSIIDSILGVTVSVISSNGSTAELTSDIVVEGNNVSLPWPENFTCDPTADQEVPIQLTFLGEGAINLSNLRIEYCAP